MFLHPAIGLKVTVFEPGRLIVLESWGVFLMERIDENGTRVLLRSRVPIEWAVLYYLRTTEIPHCIMVVGTGLP